MSWYSSTRTASKRARTARADGSYASSPVEEEQEVVAVEHVLLGLALRVDVDADGELQALHVLLAPRERALDERLDALARVHAPAVAVEAGGLAREAAVAACEVELDAEQVEEVFRVAAVDREVGVEAHLRAVQALEPRRHAVERAAPHPARGRPLARRGGGGRPRAAASRRQRGARR